MAPNDSQPWPTVALLRALLLGPQRPTKQDAAAALPLLTPPQHGAYELLSQQTLPATLEAHVEGLDPDIY